MNTLLSADMSGPLQGKRVGFVGRIGGMSRRDATQLVRQFGGIPADTVGISAELIVIGADELPLAIDDLLDAETRRAADEGLVEIITETELWERLGLLDEDSRARQLYTPAMLAELLHVPVTTVRRWHRRGLIVPAKIVHRLPYFDFQEVTTARRLANMLAAGITPGEIESKLAALSRYVRGIERPLAQLSVIVEGRQILLRQQEGLVEPGGQLRFDFEAIDRQAAEREESLAALPAVPLHQSLAHQLPPQSPEQLWQAAVECEDRGELNLAVELCRASLALGGPRPDVCFQLAELLYRLGELPAARERYFMAIELDEDFVEARANLGCVLAETGELELAVAAFQGALALHPDYADVHYHLAHTLGELDRDTEAAGHWQEFLRLTPDSPWADEARRWLETNAADSSTC